ncbi:hypothetical protein BGW38_009625, partial [Lunasporangiospora selenospora]
FMRSCPQESTQMTPSWPTSFTLSTLSDTTWLQSAQKWAVSVLTHYSAKRTSFPRQTRTEKRKLFLIRNSSINKSSPALSRKRQDRAIEAAVEAGAEATLRASGPRATRVTFNDTQIREAATPTTPVKGTTIRTKTLIKLQTMMATASLFTKPRRQGDAVGAEDAS